MVPFVVVVSLELADRPAQRSFANQDHAVEARLLYRAHKALGDGVEIRRAGGKRTVSTPAAANVSRKAAVKSGSRSCNKKRFPPRNPSTASVS